MGYLDYWSGDTANAIDELETVVRLLVEVETPYTAHALIYLAGLIDDLDRGAEALKVPCSAQLAPRSRSAPTCR